VSGEARGSNLQAPPPRCAHTGGPVRSRRRPTYADRARGCQWANPVCA